MRSIGWLRRFLGQRGWGLALVLLDLLGVTLGLWFLLTHLSYAHWISFAGLLGLAVLYSFLWARGERRRFYGGHAVLAWLLALSQLAGALIQKS